MRKLLVNEISADVPVIADPTSPVPQPASGKNKARAPAAAREGSQWAQGSARQMRELRGLLKGRNPSAPAVSTGKTVQVLGGFGLTPATPIDRAMGANLLNELEGQTLAGNAANAKHLAKMLESAEVVATIEKLPGRLRATAAFRPNDAFKLYEHSFPNPDEREPVADIKARLKTYDGKKPQDGAAFHAHVYADAGGATVGYSQGSTVPCDAGLFYYWQYGCVADRQYMRTTYDKDVHPREHGVLNTIHGVNAATLVATAKRTGMPALGLVWESEPRGLGDDAASIKFTDTRLNIHNRAGGRIMMGVTATGEYVNLHLQPRLTADSEPIALHMVFRPLSYQAGDEQKSCSFSKSEAQAIMLGWINNFRREGFAEKDVQEAENEIRARFARCEKIVLLPASEVPDVVTLAATDPILSKQVFEMYGVDSLAAARERYDAAMTSPG